MTTRRLSTGLAALSMAAVAVLGMSGTALAQGAPPDRPCGQGQGNPPTYPPGQQRQGTVEHSQVERGEENRASAPPGSFDRNSRARACMNSTPIDLGVVTASSTGAATIAFTVPETLELGRHNITFHGYFQGQPNDVVVPFTVLPAQAAAAGTAPGTSDLGSRLPRTGADHVLELTAAGLALVAVGGAVVVAARRRREQEHSSLT